jgi:hypothetical protein
VSGVWLAWLVEAGIITYRDVTKYKATNTIAGMPIPSDYLATFVIYGSLAAIAQAPSARTFAAVTAWAFVGTTLLDIFNPATLGPVTKPAGPTGPAATTTKAGQS